MCPTAPNAKTRFHRRAGRGFLRCEDGTFAVFSLFIFVAMLLVAGLAVDMMRHETVRVRMQGVTDRGVLAATMLGNNNGVATPEELLQSYFTSAGLNTYLGSNYSITESPWTGRNVTAAPAATVPNVFMNMLGIDSFTVATSATAQEQAISTWLDIVMVIDISGSMADNNRMDQLRAAASQMATSLLTDTQDGKVSLTLVPYDTMVLPPASMLPHFNNLSGTVGACPDFNTFNNVNNGINASMFLHECHTSSWGEVRPYMGDVTEAVTAINGLQPRDVTSLDLGVRWGGMFFDPTIRPAINEMVANGAVSTDYQDRPFDWNEANVVRAMVLLTDGENCCGHRYSQIQQDANTISICNLLKNRGVLIYTIAFEAPAAGQALMMNCASSPSHYFDPAVGGLLNVFEAISANVVTQTLRLTQ